MATTPKVYVICDQNCKFEGMTKEQIYTAILQAVNEGTIGNIDVGFVTTIKTINGLPLKFFVGEQAAYDELTPEDKKDLFAIITNDTTKEGIINALKDLNEIKKQIDEGKFHANGIFTKEIASLAELESLIKNNPQSSFGIRIASDINIAGAGILPKWGYGYLVISTGDAALNLIDYNGNHIVGYYNVQTWTIKDKPQVAETAIKLMDGWTYGGRWATTDDKNIGWTDFKGLYAVKLVEATNTYIFMISPDGDTTSRSNSVIYKWGDNDITCFIECSMPQDVQYLSFKCIQSGSVDSFARNFDLYWKKIF